MHYSSKSADGFFLIGLVSLFLGQVEIGCHFSNYIKFKWNVVFYFISVLLSMIVTSCMIFGP